LPLTLSFSNAACEWAIGHFLPIPVLPIAFSGIGTDGNGILATHEPFMADAAFQG
jgi:hypothetical protein